MSGLFPPLKENSFFLPRDQGGLGLIDIGSQQNALQLRYIKVLLKGNNGSIPDFTYQLLVNALRLSNDTPHHAIPLLFKSAKYRNTLNGLHPFYSMFTAMDLCRDQSSLNVVWQHKPNVTTIMSLPLIEIFNIAEGADDLEFLQKESVRESKVHEFLEYNSDQNQFQFKPKTSCLKRSTWIKLTKALHNKHLSFRTFMSTTNTAGGLDFQSLVDTLVVQQ